MSKAAAVLEAPNPTHGHPLGVDDWRLDPRHRTVGDRQVG
jgi:hypothetical protein